MTQVTLRVAEFAATAEISQAVRDIARQPFADMIGVMLTGASSAVAEPLMEYAYDTTTMAAA